VQYCTCVITCPRHVIARGRGNAKLLSFKNYSSLIGFWFVTLVSN